MPDCECPCVKRCKVEHPGLKGTLCDQPVDHQSHHQHTIEWVNEALPGWAERMAKVRANQMDKSTNVER
jgi:hypothetical protein